MQKTVYSRCPIRLGRHYGSGIVAASLLLLSQIATAQMAEHDLIFFASLEREHLLEVDSPGIDANDFTPAVDVVYSRQHNRFQLFAEALLTDEEQEIERLIASWRLSDETKIELGRFHQSSSYWNKRYHHGQYMQTSISRPAIEQFEDASGPLPLHVVGVTIEQREELDWGSGLVFSLSGGLTSRFDGDELHTMNVLRPDHGYEPGVNARIGYLPDALGLNEVGITLGKHNLAFSDGVPPPRIWDPLANEIELETASVYGNWQWSKWEVIGAVVNVSAIAKGGSDGANHDFTASYIQTERSVVHDITVFARVEHTSGDEQYLEIFPSYVRRQTLMGARWDFRDKHALTVEYTTSDAHADHLHRFALQWSAALR